MKKIVLKVNKMMCTGCENRIQNALSDIDGIESAQANHQTGMVEITTNKDIATQKIKDIISDLGFEVEGEI